MRQWTQRLSAGLICGVATLVWGLAPAVQADLVLIDFENNPALAAQPDTFDAATITTVSVPSIATVTGGKVLGNPAFVASFPVAGSEPNTYGTAFFDTSLSPNIVIEFDPSIIVTSISGVVMSGLPDFSTFIIDALTGAIVVDNDTFLDVEDNFDPASFREFGLSGTDITSVVFAQEGASDPGDFDYFIDTLEVTFTHRVIVVPEPSTLGAGLISAAVVCLGLWRRGRRAM